jgi:hypothetical protein
MAHRSTTPTLPKSSNISPQPTDLSPAKPARLCRARGPHCCEFAKSWSSNCRKFRENSALRGNTGRFLPKSANHLRYQAGNNPRILWLASLPVSAGTGGSLYFVDSAETT